MIRLRTLDLRDVGVFAGERSFDLSGKLTGIVGSNGRGKSTLLSLIHYCITGDHSRLAGSDAVALRRSSQEQPYGRLVFEIDREPASVTRWLPDGSRNGRRNLVFAGQSWAAMQDVTEQIERWAGVTMKVLSEFVFVEQDRLAAAAKDKPADRAKALRRLFGVDEADRVRTKVVEYLSELPAPPDPETVAVLRARYVETESEWLEAGKTLAGLPAPRPGVDGARALVARYSEDAAARTAIARFEGVVSECWAVLDKPRVERPDPMRLLHMSAMRDDWARHKSGTAMRDERRRRIIDLQNEINWLCQCLMTVPPEPPESPQRLTELAGKRFALETIILAPETGGKCPVCDGHLAPGMDGRSSAAAMLAELNDLEKNHAAAMDSYHRWARSEAAKQESITTNQVLLERMLTEDNDHVVPPAPTIAESQLEVLIAHHSSQVARFGVDYESRLQVRARIDEIEPQLRMLREKLADPPVTADDERDARELISKSDTLESSRREASARVEILKSAFDSARQLLEKVETAGANSEKVETHRRRVAGVRDILHSDAAPSRSVKGCLDGLSSDLNETLAGLKASYRVSVRHDGELMAEFRDGTSTSTVRASRISKGERAVLGLAWTIASARRYAPNVGVLCLDEPTDGLDRERVVALRSAFRAWADWDPDRQCIVVTHERSLMGVFDRVVDLG